MNDNKKKYWILFINDYIYFLYVILFKIKNEIFLIFKHFFNFHKWFDCLCHCFYMNKNEKYKFKKLTNFCLNKSIILKLVLIQQH